MSVIVVGAGIIGASVTLNLAARGAKVTVLERAAAPAQAATGKSWAWLNANYKKPKHYRDFNLQSMQLWQQQHPHLCHFCGCLMLHDERKDPQDDGYSFQPVPSHQLNDLEPALNPEVAKTLHHARLWPLEGWCDPVAATEDFLALAQSRGAKVLFEQQVTSIATSSSSSSGETANKLLAIVASQDGQQQQQQHEADCVIIAAGVGTADLACQQGYQLPLLHKPAAIVITQPIQPVDLIRHMIVTHTGVFILQRSDGRCLLGETHPTPSANTDTSSNNAARILQLAAAAVPALQAAQVEGVYVGERPYPADGYPVLGFISSNVYIAVTHSGMTLAPLIGQLVADEVMAALDHQRLAKTSSDIAGSVGSGNSAAELLAPYRPSRAFNAADSGNWAKAMKAVDDNMTVARL